MRTFGYSVAYGYMGWVDEYKRFMLFATEAEYIEYIK